MKREDISKAVGNIRTRYIQEAAPGKKVRRRTGWMKWVSAAACLLVLVTAVRPFMKNHTETPVPGGDEVISAPTQAPENVILPITISANGLHLVRLAYEATLTPEISTDFIIYINSEAYAGQEENGSYVIRPKTPLGEGFPECSLQIRRVADTPPAAVAESVRESLAASYLNVGDIADAAVIDGLFLHADNGSAWDARQTDITITDDLMGGSYILTARYFTEATEGHGTRFADMIGTFKVVASDDAAAMPPYLVELHDAVSEFAPAFFADRVSELGDILAQDAMISTYEEDVTEDVGIASIDYSLSGDENPTAAVVSVKHRISTEDSYNHLTIELTYTADGKWVVHFAGLEK